MTTCIQAVCPELLANCYSHQLDVRMAGGDYRMVRYADDFVVLCTSRGAAMAALEEGRAWPRRASSSS